MAAQSKCTMDRKLESTVLDKKFLTSETPSARSALISSSLCSGKAIGEP